MIVENYPQTFVAGKIECSLLTHVGTANVCFRASGFGTTCEIARANAYRELAQRVCEQLAPFMKLAEDYVPTPLQ